MSDLQKIPGVGPNIAADLEAIGIHSVDDLRGKDPEALYDVYAIAHKSYSL
jgi:predicted flap endonuclease-1-like 5' DNA nuclease